MRVAVVTVSDRASTGVYEDRTGPAVVEALQRAWVNVEVQPVLLVGDDQPAVEAILRRLVDGDEVDLVLTNGGTGLGPRDTTPEATLAVVERVVPGLPELMRNEGRAFTPLAALSRQVCGVRNRCLVLNLPGSPRGAVESLEAVVAVLGHAVAMATGKDHD